MSGILGHYSALEGYTGLGTAYVDETNHAPGAGLITQPPCTSPQQTSERECKVFDT